MGSYREIYLGPYIEVRMERKVTAQTNCNRTDCPKPDSGFCKKCGMNSSSRVTEVFYHYDFYEFFGKGEPFTTTNRTECIRSNLFIEILIPNLIGAHLPRDFHCKESNMAITPIGIQAEIDWFKDKFKSEIKKIKSEFGNVSIKWGFQSWWS